MQISGNYFFEVISKCVTRDVTLLHKSNNFSSLNLFRIKCSVISWNKNNNLNNTSKYKRNHKNVDNHREQSARFGRLE